MIQNLSELRSMITAGERKTCAVACAHDAHTLEAIMTVRNEGLMDCLLVGHTEEIKRIAAQHGYEVSDAEIIEAATDEDGFVFGTKLDYSLEAKLALAPPEVHDFYRQVSDFARSYGV